MRERREQHVRAEAAREVALVETGELLPGGRVQLGVAPQGRAENMSLDQLAQFRSLAVEPLDGVTQDADGAGEVDVHVHLRPRVVEGDLRTAHGVVDQPDRLAEMFDRRGHVNAAFGDAELPEHVGTLFG